MAGTSFTVSVPEKLKNELAAFKEVNWSAETRRFLEERLQRLKTLKRLDELLKNSRVTEEDVEAWAKEVKKEVWAKHKRAG